jgi:predicted TIM-barrel fold metal-dependent hydrolase
MEGAMKIAVGFLFLLLLAPLRARAQDDEAWPPYDYLRNDYRAVAVVAHVRIEEAVLVSQIPGYDSWQLTGEVVEPFKGPPAPGEPIVYFIGVEAPSSVDEFLGDRVVFLLAENNTERGDFYVALENATLPFREGLSERLRRVAAERIIDVHLHAFGWDEYGTPPPPNEVTGARPEARSDEAVLAAVLAEMDRYNITTAVASGPAEQVQRWRAAAPDRILGGAYTGARDSLPDVEHLRQAFTEGRLRVLGELGLQYRGLSPADPRLEPYFALAEELDVPVALHTGLGDEGMPYGCCPGFRVTLGNPLLLEEVLVRHPGMRVYLMHAGYPYLQETKALLYIYPQLYVDVAVINWAIPREAFHAYLKALVDAGFGGRIMFGSDQMIWPGAIGLAVDGIESAEFLSEEEKRDIFYNNAARFLRLDGAAGGRRP